MSGKRESAQEKIILATIECYEKYGLYKVSVRTIAKEAGVNPAAINYYFRSKDDLQSAVIDRMLKNAFMDWTHALEGKDNSPRSIIGIFLEHSLEGMVRYPGLVRGVISDPKLAADPSSPAAKAVDKILTDLLNIVASGHSEEARAELRLSLVQMFGAVMSAGVLAGGFGAFLGLDLRNPEAQKKFVAHLLQKHLPPESSLP